MKPVNGLDSYFETVFEITCACTVAFISEKPNKLKTIYDNGGRTGVWSWCEAWADEFEFNHIDEDWDELDFFDTIDAFIQEKIYERTV